MTKYKIHIIVLLGLIALNFVFFAFNLNDFFLSDDFDWLHLTQFSEQPIWSYFASNYYGEIGQGGSYRPMVNVVFWMNYHLFKLNPIGYHLFSIIFHIGVCFLIYLLALELFAKAKNKFKIAILASVFFSLLPNHSEAVIWIAAVADPLASFFYLLAFYLYLIFRRKLSFLALVVSVISFIFALSTKELAISLPLLIIVWELYQAIIKQKFSARDILFYPFGYWIILAAYFLLRFKVIGLAFGYYADDKFIVSFNSVFKMIASLVTDLVFYGKYRIWLTEYFFANKIFFVLFLVLLVSLILTYLHKKFYKAAFLIDMFVVLSLPVVFLAFNNLSDEGERYAYLPSVAFAMLLSLIVSQIKENYLRYVLLISILIYFAFFLGYKNYDWQIASQLNQKLILEDLPRVVDLEKENYFVALPDNLSGVPVLRNGVILASNLFYPQVEFSAQVLGAYQRLSTRNYSDKVLYWGTYPTGGYIAETFDQLNWVTGFDRIENNEYIFELWNYDYPTYTSNTIRLILKDAQGDFIPAGKEDVNIIIFDRGGLQTLNELVSY